MPKDDEDDDYDVGEDDDDDSDGEDESSEEDWDKELEQNPKIKKTRKRQSPDESLKISPRRLRSKRLLPNYQVLKDGKMKVWMNY